MKEVKKIGYLALIVGAISMGEAWLNIIAGRGDYIEAFFLGLGLVSSLAGIALIVTKNKKIIRE